MKQITLKEHFYKNIHNNSELIGLKVSTIDGDEYYINDFDQMVDSASLPRWVFISEKQGSNFGNTKETSELYVNK
jgi:hypothetical protein